MVLNTVKNTASATLKVVKLPIDIMRGLNTTIWGGVEGAEKVGRIVKTGGAAADTIIGVDLALQDCARGDYFCTSLDVIGSISSTTGLILGNLPATKQYTVWTGSITVCCRTVRIYCQKYGTFWGCVAMAVDGTKKVIQHRYNIPT